MMEFKDYKEKQNYYKNLSRNETLVWDSGVSARYKGKLRKSKLSLVKGRTYIKPKEEK